MIGAGGIEDAFDLVRRGGGGCGRIELGAFEVAAGGLKSVEQQGGLARIDAIGNEMAKLT